MITWLVKDCLDVLINSITNIVNKSLSLSVYPRSMKAALVKPLIFYCHVYVLQVFVYNMKFSFSERDRLMA